jgi:hypothetical protein
MDCSRATVLRFKPRFNRAASPRTSSRRAAISSATRSSRIAATS